MRHYLSFLFFVLLLSGCQEKKADLANEPTLESETYGLNSVVLLTQDTNWVVLSDYFKDVSAIDSIHLPKGLSYDWRKGNDGFHLCGQMEDWIAPMEVFFGNTSRVVPLKKPARERVQLTFDPEGRELNSVDFVSDLNGWAAGANPFLKGGDQWVLEMDLYPGGYAYRLQVNGEQQLDPNSPDSVPNGFGAFNSFLKVEQLDREQSPHLTLESSNEDFVHIITTVDGGKWLALWQNQRIEKAGDDHLFDIPEAAKKMDRSYIRIWSGTEEGLSNEIRIPLANGKVIKSADQLTRQDHERDIMYFMMVDRFANGDSSNDEPVQDMRIRPKANYFGGDLAGIQKTLESGYFDSLGINTLWISPITQNPTGAFQEYPEPRRWFSGYHGYWPISFKKVDHRLGTNAELKTLVDESHAKDKNIILDYVCNHVHQEHPMIVAHPEWKTDLELPNGERNLRRWDEYRLTTWFDDFLPTLDFSIPEVIDVMSDSAVWWMKEYGFDGFRHDATKHIPEEFWRTNTLKLKQLSQETGRNYFQVGETFGSRELIQSYIGSGMMDGQFDFNLYFDAVTAFKGTSSPMSKLGESLMASLSFHGDLHKMCNITGNHDLTRFISLASGAVRDDEDQKEAGWQREIKVEDPIGYEKLKMLETFIMTIPGIPVIFYGDEIGMPGANDPDNRRMMRFNDIEVREQSVMDHVSKITRIRAEHMALLFGDLQILESDDQILVYERNYFQDRVITCFNNGDSPRMISFEAGSYLWASDGTSHDPIDGKITIELQPFTSLILYTE